VEIVIDAGGGVRTYEVTRGGTPVRTAHFTANRILVLVEHPATDHPIGEEVIGSLPQ
jgi:hypothetical protein